MKVSILNVGDEILDGDIQNTNSTWLASRLSEIGVDVERICVLPDRVADISSTVSEHSRLYDAVVVTGGLGPTHDDVTVEAVGRGLDRNIEVNDEALEYLREGYAGQTSLEATAELPENCRVVMNHEGVAPGCIVENVYVFPGVPVEMKSMFEKVKDEFEGDETYTRFVYTTMYESQIIGYLEEVRQKFDVQVGSYPGGEGEEVRVKLTSGDEDEVEDAADWLSVEFEES
ncbi:MAG: molybdopterin-binding protein [Halobacteria archaeon]|nr:molybdopterin-binding protein [Halobacteria archaeon]